MSPRDKTTSASRQEAIQNKSLNESSGDDLFGDMDVDFVTSPTIQAPSSSSSYAKTTPLSNVNELGNLVLTSPLASTKG